MLSSIIAGLIEFIIMFSSMILGFLFSRAALAFVIISFNSQFQYKDIILPSLVFGVSIRDIIEVSCIAKIGGDCARHNQ